MNFQEAAKEYLEFIDATRSDGTYRYQNAKVKTLMFYFEDVDLDTINKRDIIKLINYLRKRNPSIKAVTINKYISILKRIIKYSSERIIYFEPLPTEKKIVPVLDKETIAIIFNYFQKRLNEKTALRNYLLFKLILDTGLRISEALALRLQDFDFTTNTIHVKITKTKSERFVFFTDSTESLLKRLIAKGKVTDHIFMNYQSNTVLKMENVQATCYRLRNTLNLKQNVRPHRWRHTFATNFLKSGGNLESLRLILGHTSLKTTQIYLHLDKDHLQDEYFKVFS